MEHGNRIVDIKLGKQDCSPSAQLITDDQWSWIGLHGRDLSFMVMLNWLL